MYFAKRFGLLGLLLLVLLSGCSQPVSIPKKEKIQEKAVGKEPATDLDGYLKEGPGKFAGNAYDEKKVQAELDQLPNNLSTKEVHKQLILLLAEDYQPVVSKLDNFNTTYDLNNQTPGEVQAPPGKEVKPLNVSILLDSSGSMAGKVSGRVKMDLAKSAVVRFASSLPNQANVSLRVYGHKGSNSNKDKAESCKSTEEVYPFAPYNGAQFNQALKQFKPTGWTPIAVALEAAKQDLNSKGEHADNVIYVVSDGIETCGGNPVQVAKQLHESNMKAIVNIIGFDVDNAGQRALKEVADAGGGEYETVSSETDLRNYFDAQYTKLWLEWDAWSVQNQLSLSKQYTDKQMELQKITGFATGEFDKQIITERERMEKAIAYLAEKGKISSDIQQELSGIIFRRSQQLSAFRQERNEQLNVLIEKNKSVVQETIAKKAEEMKEKYK